MDGSEVKVNGQTQMTTTPQDIAVLSNVFTGWSYEDRPYLNDDPRYPLTRDRTTLDYVDNATSASNATTGSKVTDELVWINDGKLHFYFSNGLQFRRSLRDLVPLRGDRAGYPQEIRPIGAQPNPGSIRIHPQDDAVIAQVKPASGKLTFLGKPFAMKTTPTESLDAALEIIFAHQNLAPFVAKQMIQHMVTSNPTPAYVQRVAVAFKKANWDMKTLITAILLDEEARLTTYANSPTFGRLREPFLRVLGMMRALGYSGCYTNLTNQTTDPTKARNLNHGPLCAPSVFNDFSPTYQYLGNESAKGEMAALGKVIPQMQIATETAVIAYINAVYEILNVGIVADMTATVETGDLWPLNVELTKLNTPLDMANFVNRKLFGNGMSTELKAAVQAAATGDTSKKRERLKAAIFTAVVSTEYLVQR
jgi:uncharacterized protein (DUF1800 family)